MRFQEKKNKLARVSVPIPPTPEPIPPPQPAPNPNPTPIPQKGVIRSKGLDIITLTSGDQNVTEQSCEIRKCEQVRFSILSLVEMRNEQTTLLRNVISVVRTRLIGQEEDISPRYTTDLLETPTTSQGV